MGSSDESAIEAFRRELRKILDSPEFVGSRRVSEFLEFASEAAFRGETHLGQRDIAERVLHRSDDFDPVDDASVRKLATLTRQRLEHYFSNGGANDPVVVTLPPRCYVPRYRLRETPARPLETAEPARELPERTKRFGRLTLLLSIASLAIGMAVLLGLRAIALRPANSAPQFEIVTQKGDIMHRMLELAPGAIQLGPEVGVSDDVTARLTFTPQKATQQAGILIFENPDHYVKLARHFNTRTQLEFGLESGGVYRKTPATFTYDPSGQTGAPVWLSIRRTSNIYRAFISGDGLEWRRVGDTLEMPDPMSHPRLAVFAFNGKTNAPSAKAVFDRVSLGIGFHDRLESETSLPEFDGWTSENSCGVPGQVSIQSFGLEFRFLGERKPCLWKLTRSAPAGDWSFTALIDHLPVSGDYAGLSITGRRGTARLIRWGLNDGSITLEQIQQEQTSASDFPGSPPLLLRLEAAKGIMTGAFSRDFSTFTRIPASVKLKDLGDNLRIGITAGMSSWTGLDNLPPARFLFVRQDVRALVPYRIAAAGGT